MAKINYFLGSFIVYLFCQSILLANSKQQVVPFQPGLFEDSISVNLVQHLVPGMDYVCIGTFNNYHDAARACFNVPELPYLRLVYMASAAKYKVLFGPFTDGRVCLSRVRTEFCPTAVLNHSAENRSEAVIKTRKPFEKSVITNLGPNNGYIQVGAYTNEEDARNQFKAYANPLYDIAVYKPRDGIIRLLFGPIYDCSQHLSGIKASFCKDAFILSSGTSKNGQKPDKPVEKAEKNIASTAAP